MDLEPSIPAVTVEQARAMVDEDAVFMDVREEKEWDTGHLMHSVHASFHELADTIRHTSRTRRVVVISRSGVRAEVAVRHLRTAGVDAVLLDGGLLAWQAAGGELVAGGGGSACLL